jgi:hypothetical protein
VNPIIAVALITSISTLSGGAITAFAAVLVGRSNGNNQLVLAAAERVDRLNSTQRQIRRDAYVQYLNQLSSAQRSLDAAWRTVPPAQFDAELYATPITAELDALQQMLNLIRLEGPAQVVEPADALQARLTLQSVDLINAARKSKGHAPCIFDEKKFVDVKLEAATLNGKVIVAMRTALSS